VLYLYQLIYKFFRTIPLSYHNQAEIIAFNGNFHGRTMAPVSLSSEAEYQRGYGPLLDGFRKVLLIVFHCQSQLYENHLIKDHIHVDIQLQMIKTQE
jgi:acetylornithine/succinyldiaminopimelate/putrescine aminotransferase